MALIRLLEPPRSEFPMNAPGGLYIYLLSEEGRIPPSQIHDFCRPIARRLGYHPNGDCTIGMATPHGHKSFTYAVWYHDQTRRGFAEETDCSPDALTEKLAHLVAQFGRAEVEKAMAALARPADADPQGTQTARQPVRARGKRGAKPPA